MESTLQVTKLSFSETVSAYRDLMKIRIVALLVFTTVTAMIVAQKGIPDPVSLVATVLGGILASGGASALNQYLDREMDARMQRTARRPIPSGRINPTNALVFGLALVAWSVLVLGIWVNWLSAFLAFLGAVYYVILYTAMLKRNTALNIVIGGGAGAMPVLVGWAAVSNSVPLEAWLLFAIVFYWTPPHSWALALLVNKDYEAVGVPMMPVARGEETTRRQILLYSIQLVAITLIPLLGISMGADMLGGLYVVCAMLLGGGLLYYCVRLMQEPTKAMARILYKYSSLYLAALFMAMILDRLVMPLF